MENAMRTTENKIDQLDHTINGQGRKLSAAINEGSEEIKHYASDIAHKFKGVSGDAIKESVSFAKRYPIYTALGAATIGFFAGFLVKRS